MRTRSTYLFIVCLIISCNQSKEVPVITKEKSQYLSKAYHLYTERNWDEALAITKEFLKSEPHFYTAYLLEAKTLFFSGEEQMAITKLEKLTKKHPDYYEAQFWLARFYYLVEDFTSAVTILNKLMYNNTHDPKVLYLSSLIDIQEDKLDIALDKLYKASIAREDIAMIYYKISEIFIEIGALDKAVEQLYQGKKLVTNGDLLAVQIDQLLEELIQGDTK